MSSEADRIEAKRNWRGDEEEQIKSQERSWVRHHVPVIQTYPFCVFFQAWLSGLQTSSVELKFCHLSQTHCLCSSHSTWPSCTSTVPVSGFRSMTCKVCIIKRVIRTWFLSENTYEESRKERDGTWPLLSPNQSRECSTKDRDLPSNILSSRRERERETFGYQQPLPIWK